MKAFGGLEAEVAGLVASADGGRGMYTECAYILHMLLCRLQSWWDIRGLSFSKQGSFSFLFLCLLELERILAAINPAVPCLPVPP